jgi:hypothetical protein
MNNEEIPEFEIKKCPKCGKLFQIVKMDPSLAATVCLPALRKIMPICPAIRFNDKDKERNDE